MWRDHSNKWKLKHTSFWWKPLGTNHKLPHSSTLIVFLHENELFQRGWGVFVTLVEIPKGWGVISSLQKWKIQGGGGVLSEIPSVVGVWIFSGTTHYEGNVSFTRLNNFANGSKKNPETLKVLVWLFIFSHILSVSSGWPLFKGRKLHQHVHANSSFSPSRNKHGTKKYIWNRPVEEAKKMKCYKRLI